VPSHESRVTSHEVWLKLENLQPIGSFKIRGAGNAMRRLPKEALRDGVCTASAGNMAQGVAWCARELGVPCRVIAPDRAPAAKVDAIKALGAEAILVPFADWWRVMETHDTRGVPGAFIHPVENNDVMAGNGTIALEIVEALIVSVVEILVHHQQRDHTAGGKAEHTQARTVDTRIVA
jgi:threonine dehydratase